MKFSYKFSNLIGTVYRDGNILFTPNGNSLICAVGNRLSLYDLKNNKSQTLSFEAKFKYNCLALSPDGKLLIAVTERGDAHFVSLNSCLVVHRHKFQSKVQCVKFSPNGVYFAVAKENHVFVFHSPVDMLGDYNPLRIKRHLVGGYDDVTSLDWTTNSQFLAIGCRDNTTRIYSIDFCTNFRSYILGGHTEPIVACFFENNSLHINTISRKGELCLWECSLKFSDCEKVTDYTSITNIKKKKNKEIEADDDVENTIDQEDNDVEQETVNEDKHDKHPFSYKRLAKHYLADEARKKVHDAFCTAADFNYHTQIMVVAFNTGDFYLYEIPDVNLIHSLNISCYAISTVSFNCTGDWVALASQESGQLVVWEWQSEQFIMKQQGHNGLETACISYSPDGQCIASGGYDGKINLWSSRSGLCFLTLSDHKSVVTSLEFSKTKNFLISCSLDGTVRAFDLVRYRNFRSFCSPNSDQFVCASIDRASELVAAGCQNVFEIYLWSMKLGNLLEVIKGHEGPITAIVFSPLTSCSTLISGSLDQTIKIWNCLENDAQHETITLNSDVCCLAFEPNGEHIAVGTINGNITFFDVKSAVQIASIEGCKDLDDGNSYKVSTKSNKKFQGKFFQSIEYSFDGKCILAGGNSIYICIYQVSEAILLKKFEISQNRSNSNYINRKDMNEFGNIALIEYRKKLKDYKSIGNAEGLKNHEIGEEFNTEPKTYSLKFSPTGQAYCVASTEGLCIYSLNKDIVFDPLDLCTEITPKTIRDGLRNRDYLRALSMSLKLNETNYISSALENVQFCNIKLLSSTLSNEIPNRLIQNIARILQSTPHIQFYLQWCNCILSNFGYKDGIFLQHSLVALYESLFYRYDSLNKICNFNKFTIKRLLSVKEKRCMEENKNHQITF